MDLRLIRADGSAARDAVVSFAEAPVSMPDIAAVADARGWVSVTVPATGDYVLGVWVDGRMHRVPCRLEGSGAGGGGRLVMRLPT